MDLHGEVLAPAEGAADAGEMDAHLLGLESEAGRDLVAIDVEPLGGDVDVDAALPVGDGQAGLGAEEGLILDAELVDALHRDGAFRVGITVADGQLAERVLGALGLDDRLLRDVVDLDLGRRAARLLGVLGGDDCDRLPEVAHVLHGQDRLVGELEAVALLSRDVLVREHGVNAGHPARLARVDALEARGRVRAADGVAEEHAGGEEVARVGELAGDLGDGVDAADGLADAPELEPAGGSAHFRVSFGPELAPCARPMRDRFGGTLESGWWFGVAPFVDSSAGRQPHRVEDLRVPRTAAEVAAQRLADLVVRGLRHPPQEIHRRHDQPGRAEPALHRPRRRERLLHRMQLPLRRPQPLHGHDLVPVRLRGQHQASAHELSVQQDRARPALSLLARVLRPRQPQVLAQRVEQALALPDLGLALFPVDRQGDPHVRHLFSARSTSTCNACRR